MSVCVCVCVFPPTLTPQGALLDKLNGAESWLYGDGFDEKKEVYQMHLDQLKAHGDPIARREHESTHRGDAVRAVGQTVEQFKKIATSSVRPRVCGWLRMCVCAVFGRFRAFEVNRCR